MALKRAVGFFLFVCFHLFALGDGGRWSRIPLPRPLSGGGSRPRIPLPRPLGGGGPRLRIPLPRPLGGWR